MYLLNLTRQSVLFPFLDDIVCYYGCSSYGVVDMAWACNSWNTFFALYSVKAYLCKLGMSV